MASSKTLARRAPASVRVRRYLQEYGPLWVLSLPALTLLLLFSYIPMAGLVIVFKDYDFL